jgi:hypothetical protein
MIPSSNCVAWRNRGEGSSEAIREDKNEERDQANTN